MAAYLKFLKFVLSLCSVITLQTISAEQALTEAKGWGQPLPCTASLGSQTTSVLICSLFLLGNETKLIKIQPANRCQSHSVLPEPALLSQGLTPYQSCLKDFRLTGFLPWGHWLFLSYFIQIFNSTPVLFFIENTETISL